MVITMPATSLFTEVTNMAQCVACGVELEPPVRASHTVYFKTVVKMVDFGYMTAVSHS